MEQSLLFYPLEVGDFWQYSVYGNIPSFIISREVVGDTLMPNGHRYRVILSEGPRHTSQSYVRVDSTSAVVYAYDKSAESDSELLRLAPMWADSTVAADQRLRCHFPSTVVWRGLDVEAQVCEWSSWNLSEESTFAAGIGLTYFYHQSEGAIIQDLVYVSTSHYTHGVRVGRQEPDELPTTGIALYPNPASGSVTLELDTTSMRRFSVEVYDSLGRLVHQAILDSNQMRGQRWSWSPGLDIRSGLYHIVVNGAGEAPKAKSVVLIR